MAGQCKGVTLTKSPCCKFAAAGSDYCKHHQKQSTSNPLPTCHSSILTTLNTAISNNGDRTRGPFSRRKFVKAVAKAVKIATPYLAEALKMPQLEEKQNQYHKMTVLVTKFMQMSNVGSEMQSQLWTHTHQVLTQHALPTIEQRALNAAAGNGPVQGHPIVQQGQPPAYAPRDPAVAAAIVARDVPAIVARAAAARAAAVRATAAHVAAGQAAVLAAVPPAAPAAVPAAVVAAAEAAVQAVAPAPAPVNAGK
ncbi:uncharacterized protein K452DRAFT_313235 [Aplosporella prunicola CBS 121167]|uniref:Uncharacterized protein n=1 Tax=Aplosporella prunicola CBS 121167 TaxID=1176127 RepID=A0A6A6AWP7_9PEZI|nr:uncharacterized protein K452DRAFT_313235 [Aplosporella prunicola CBS 121167]KAF2136369.1 hypothetical protein K452DRAFT_313235 [Aplosporella prunicola CBS 121167]